MGSERTPLILRGTGRPLLNLCNWIEHRERRLKGAGEFESVKVEIECAERCGLRSDFGMNRHRKR